MNRTLSGPLELKYELWTSVNGLGATESKVFLFSNYRDDKGNYGLSIQHLLESAGERQGLPSYVALPRDAALDYVWWLHKRFCDGKWKAVQDSDGAYTFGSPRAAFEAVTEFAMSLQAQRLCEEVTEYRHHGHLVVDERAENVNHVINPLEGDWKLPPEELGGEA
jgi:hypothetical protein